MHHIPDIPNLPLSVSEAVLSGHFTAFHHLGWVPIPLKSRDKVPSIQWKAYQHKGSSLEECSLWDAGNHNVGIVTGKISGIFVLDIDGLEGDQTLKALERQYGTLPDTVVAGTGNGMHFYFRYPRQEGCTVRNLSSKTSQHMSLPHIDVRGDGGYVVAPPSIHPSGREYVWHHSPWEMEVAAAPEWLLNLVTTKIESPALDLRTTQFPSKEPYLQAALRDELTLLAQASHGMRNAQLNKSSFALGQLIHAGLQEQEARSRLEGVALAIGLEKQEASRTIESGINAGMAHPRTDKTDTVTVSSVVSVGEPCISEKNAWPEPKPVKQELLSVPPLDPNIIPEPLRAWLVDIADRMQCPLDYVAASSITVLSSLIGARCSMRPKRHDPNWFVVPNLWGMIVGKPSSLKSPALQETMRPLKKLELASKEQYEKELEDYKLENVAVEAMQEHIKKQIAMLARGGKLEGKTIDGLRQEYAAIEKPKEPLWRRYHSNDATVEKLSEILATNPQGLLVFRDELIGLLKTWEKEGHAGDRAFFLEGWNGYGSHITDRIGRGTVFTGNVCLSILGSTQPSRLNHYLYQSMKDVGNDGLIQRFQLMVFPDENKQWELVDRPDNMFAKGRVEALFMALDAMDFCEYGACRSEHHKLPYYQFTDEAQSLFFEWLSVLEVAKLRAGEDGLILEHLAKYRKLMPALALIFHLIRVADGTGSGQVSQEAVELAISWCEYLEQHARRIYHMVTDVSQQAAAALAKRISKGELEDHFTVRTLYRKGWYMLNDQELAEAACDELVRLGWIREYQTPPTAKGGRGKITYIIHPGIKERAEKKV